MSDPTSLAAPARDARQLRHLAVAHYVVAAIFLVLTWYPATRFFSMLRSDELNRALDAAQSGLDFSNLKRLEALILVTLTGTTAVLGVVHTGLTVWAGWCIQVRRWRTFPVVVAFLNCLAIPVGTILAVFTLVILYRPSVRAMFAQSRS